MEELTTRLETLERELRGLRDRENLRSLLARYAQLATSGQSREIMETLWCPDQAVTLEWGPSGVYQGRMGLTFFYDKDPAPGRFTAWNMGLPWLAVEGDEARGVCTADVMLADAGDLGETPPETLAQRQLMSAENAGGQYRAEWLRLRMEFTFRRTEAGWRIAALRVCELLRAPCGGDWVTFALARIPTDGLRTDALFLPSHIPPMPQNPPEFNASRASEWFWQYSPEALPPELPACMRD